MYQNLLVCKTCVVYQNFQDMLDDNLHLRIAAVANYVASYRKGVPPG